MIEKYLMRDSSNKIVAARMMPYLLCEVAKIPYGILNYAIQVTNMSDWSGVSQINGTTLMDQIDEADFMIDYNVTADRRCRTHIRFENNEFKEIKTWEVWRE